MLRRVLLPLHAGFPLINLDEKYRGFCSRKRHRRRATMFNTQGKTGLFLTFWVGLNHRFGAEITPFRTLIPVRECGITPCFTVGWGYSWSTSLIPDKHQIINVSARLVISVNSCSNPLSQRLLLPILPKIPESSDYSPVIKKRQFWVGIPSSLPDYSGVWVIPGRE